LLVPVTLTFGGIETPLAVTRDCRTGVTIPEPTTLIWVSSCADKIPVLVRSASTRITHAPRCKDFIALLLKKACSSNIEPGRVCCYRVDCPARLLRPRLRALW